MKETEPYNHSNNRAGKPWKSVTQSQELPLGERTETVKENMSDFICNTLLNQQITLVLLQVFGGLLYFLKNFFQNQTPICNQYHRISHLKINVTVHVQSSLPTGLSVPRELESYVTTLLQSQTATEASTSIISKKKNARKKVKQLSNLGTFRFQSQQLLHPKTHRPVSEHHVWGSIPSNTMRQIKSFDLFSYQNFSKF